MTDIVNDTKSKKLQDKVNSVQKLVFLYLQGIDVKPFAFTVIECISSQEVNAKRSGYLASNFAFGSSDMQTLSTNLYINDIKSKSLQVKMMALSSLASCPSPNAEQVHTLLPVLLEQLQQQQSQSLSNTQLLIKLVATTLRILVLGKRKGIESISDHVPTFIDVLFNLVSAGQLTNDAVLAQVYAHCALEVGRNFGHEYVMKLLPSLYDILLTAIQPWVLIEVVRFFGFMAVHDQRIKSKIRQQFQMLLTNTESKSLVMELAGAAAEGFIGDTQLLQQAAERLAKYVMPTGRTDMNLKTLAVRLLGRVERASPGIVMRIDGLASEIIRCLDDKDFNLRVVVLDVIANLANQQFLQNIVNKLLLSLKETKQTSQGTSIETLHQISSSDILSYKKHTINIILEMCKKDNYYNVRDLNWFIDVLITLCMEYPAQAADPCAQALLELSLKSDVLRPDVAKLADIILRNNILQQMCQQCGNVASIIGPVSIGVREPLYVQQQAIGKLLSCRFGSCQPQTRELIDHIEQKVGAQISLSQFAQFYYKLMDESGMVQHRPQRVERPTIYEDCRMFNDQQIDEALALNGLFQTCAYVMGNYLCYQAAVDESVNLYDAIDLLLSPDMKKMPIETQISAAHAAMKAFITVLFTYKQNNLFEDEDMAKQCISDGYYKQFLVQVALTEEEQEELRQKLISERDARNAQIDFTFLTDTERAAYMAEPEVPTMETHAVASLARLFAQSYERLLGGLRELTADPQMRQQCSALYHIGVLLYKEVDEILDHVNQEDENDKQVRQELCNRLLQYKESYEQVVEKVPEDRRDVMEPLATAALSATAEPRTFAQRRAARPEFAFEDGTFFSLDDPQGCILDSYDMYSYQFEEYQEQQDAQPTKRRRHRSKHHDQQQGENEQDDGAAGKQGDTTDSAFHAFVEQPVEEPSRMETPVSDAADQQMEDLFGRPAVASAFVIDRAKLQRTQPRVELGKYTRGLRLGASNTVAMPQVQLRKQPQQQQETQQEEQKASNQDGEHKRRRKHRKHQQEEENEKAEQPQQVEEIVQQEEEKPQPEKEEDQKADVQSKKEQEEPEQEADKQHSEQQDQEPENKEDQPEGDADEPNDDPYGDNNGGDLTSLFS